MTALAIGTSSIAGASPDAENTKSVEAPGSARPWTAEEMGAAKPLPLPTVDSTAKDQAPGFPHAGRGETKPAQRPENKEEPTR
jgi:hypothetical protein